MGTQFVSLDPLLAKFAWEMEKQLIANRHRGDWKQGLTGNDFDEGVKRNLKDLKSFTEASGDSFRQRAAIDLANFALMYWAAMEKLKKDHP